MEDKCFCHLNGYRVKDAEARSNIETLRESLNNKADISYVEELIREVDTLENADVPIYVFDLTNITLPQFSQYNLVNTNFINKMTELANASLTEGATPGSFNLKKSLFILQFKDNETLICNSISSNLNGDSFQISGRTITSKALNDMPNGGKWTSVYYDITINGTYNRSSNTFTGSKFTIVPQFNSSPMSWNKTKAYYLAKNNTDEFTPTANYHPATKKYVDDSVKTKQDKLTAGTNITIDENNVISATGGSGGSVDLTNYYTKDETNNLLNNKVDSSTYNSKVSELETSIGNKVDTTTYESGLAGKVDRSNFAVITGTLTIPAGSTSSSWSDNLTLPEGFTTSNSVVVSYAFGTAGTSFSPFEFYGDLQNSDEDKQAMVVRFMNSNASVKIRIGASATSDTEFNYKVVLMKISN